MAGNKRKGNRPSFVKILLVTVLVVVILVAVMFIALYAYMKTQYLGKSNYVKNQGYTINQDIQRETYVDEEGNVQVETDATLESEKESEVLAEQEEVLQGLQEDTVENTGTYNLLLIGVDRRDDSWYGNSDVMMLVTVNHERKTVYLTSFLRDLYANIPEVGVRKLNASCAYGGAELCVETIKRNYGVQIDNYAMVDFNAMIEIVGMLGGIELEVTEDEVKVANQYVKSMCAANDEPYEDHELIGSGLLQLDGYQAVAYARNRYTGQTSDFGRTERQRKVISAIIDKAQSGGIGSINAFSSLLQAVLPYVTHDIDDGTLLKLVSKLPDWLEYSLEQQHIPYDGMYHSENEILIPDMEETIKKLRETIY